MAQLDALFRPRGIAVVGASARPLTIGNRIIRNLLRYGFSGPVHPVNPRGGEIAGLPVFRSILDVPGDIDLAHVIVRADLVASTLEDCAARGIKVVIVNSSGFKEIGPRGAEMEQRIVEIARRTGMRLFGPNCQGVMNSDPRVNLYSNFTFAKMTPGHVSVVAQGGGVAEVINNYFGMNGIGQRMYASNGNACDISIPEIIEYYGEDDETHVIVLHLESFADPGEFLARVAPVAARKPVLALKSGTTPEGARAVSSHTGGLMEQDTTTDVLLDKCGVLRFSSLSELCQVARAFATQPVPAGNGVGMVTNAGSPAIIVTDELVKAGMKVPPLSRESRDFLQEKLQSMASLANPIDMMATASGQEFGWSLEALLGDPCMDAVVVCFMTPFFVDTLAIARAIEEQARNSNKTLLAVAMTNPDEKPEWRETIDRVNAAGVPVFYFPESAAQVLFHMDRFRRLRDRRNEPAPRLDVDAQGARGIIASSHPGPDGFLPPAEVADILRSYGIPMVSESRASDWNGLQRAALEIGFPVVLKAEAADLLHKTDAGGVALGIADMDQLKEAHQDMARRLRGVEGVRWLLQPSLEATLEIIVGASRSPGVGPIVMFGLGGIHVEVLKDVVFKLAPLSATDTREMLDGVKARALLHGVRGKPGVDLAALRDIIHRVSLLMEENPSIQELDLNPVMASNKPGGTKVVDARLRLVREK